MKEKGVVKYSLYSFDCLRMPTQEDHLNAAQYKIRDFKTLFNYQSKNKSLLTKKSLANNYPVVIGIYTTSSFCNIMGDTWWPMEEEYGTHRDGHAMVAVGYDDNKEGGALLVMNSWGTEWGDKGFVWIPYQVFDSFAMMGAELIDFPTEEASMEGSVTFRLKDGGEMNATYDRQNKLYKMNKAYPSGTTFQFTITIHTPSYVYALGSDLTNKSYRIFPQDPLISPYINYKESNLIFPGEGEYVQMDEQTGTDYFCILCSEDPLDYERLLSDLEQATGPFRKRLENVLGERLASPERISFENDQLSFKSYRNEKGVIPLIIEITHL